ncbi:MAG: TorF family putative porin [Verrucomicrobiota bacterium JB025]|nr:TorF family putative porin [Verrucomicrobiota bacterium JB025]
MQIETKAILMGLLALTSNASFAGEWDGETSAVVSVPAEAKADDQAVGWPTLSGTVQFGYESTHLFRGVDSGGGDPIVWASAMFSPFEGMNLGVWYGTGPDTDYEELDLVADYTFDLEYVAATAGVVWYDFPGGFADDSTDFFVKFSREFEPVPGFLVTPYLNHVFNESADGWYFEGGVNLKKPLSDRVTLSLTGWLAASTGYRDDDGLDNATVSLSLPVSLSEQAALVPYVSASAALDALDSTGGDEVSAGATLVVRF